MTSNRLPVLAGTIQSAHRLVKRRAQETADLAIVVGHHLIEAKGLVPHGQWRSWLAANVEMPERTASGYMSLARSGLKSATVADMGLRVALAAAGRRHLRRPKRGESLLVEAGRDLDGYREHVAVVMLAAEAGRYHVRSLWLPPEEQLGGYFETTRRPVPFDFLRVNLMLTLGTDDWSASVVADDDPLADFVWRMGEQVMGDAA